jgi:phage terminase small subunit
MSTLNPKEAAFVQQYLIDSNGKRAAIAAGYKEKSAESMASQLLKRPHIAAAYAAAKGKQVAKLEITAERILAELAKIGFSDIRKVARFKPSSVEDVDMTKDGIKITRHVSSHVEVTDSDDLDDDTAGAISEVSQTKDGVKVKLYDKQQALIQLGKHLGMFKEKVEVGMDESLAALVMASIAPKKPDKNGS